MKDYKLTQEEFDGVIHYYASFVDESGVEQTTEIALEVFKVIDASQRKISSQARRDRRYGLCSFDDSIADFAFDNESEDELIDALYKVMETLTEVQKRRIILHYFKKKTYEEIAKIEGTNKAAIQQSIDLALKKFEKLKNLFH